MQPVVDNVKNSTKKSKIINDDTNLEYVKPATKHNDDEDNVINAFIVSHLDSTYKKYCKIINKLQTHIEKLFDNNLIDLSNRTCYLKILNNAIKLLNLTYNDNLKQLDDTNVKSNNFINNFILNNYKNLGDNVFNYGNELLNIYQTNDSNNTYLSTYSTDKFKNIKDIILKDVCFKIGFNSIKFATQILNISNRYDTEQFELYNKIFIPLNYNKINVENDISFDDNKEIFIAPSNLKYDNLNEYGRLYLKINNNTFYTFDGYFKIDTLGVIRRTSQINYPRLFDKIKQVELALKSTNIPDVFYKNYIKNNCPLSCIIIHNVPTICNAISTKYIEYNNIHNMTLTELLDHIETIDETNIAKFYETIKLILLKTAENIYNENNNICEFIGPMFEAIKNNNILLQDKELLELLYKHFSFNHQLKLKNLLTKDIVVTNIDNDLKKKIRDHKYMPSKVKKCAMEKLKEMKMGNSNEYGKQSTYVKTLLNYPWPTPDDDLIISNLKDNESVKTYLDDVANKLDENIYGFADSKKSIVELIGKWITKPNSPGYSLGLCGPPGIGKTLFAKAIGKAMGIPFTQITLGGQNDGELLHGHGYTYSGSQPGLIVKKMVEAGNSRCIMYFDELDKACKKHDSNEIFNILVHLTDPNTNTQFQDRFFQEINFPLNKVLFIFSYNDDRLIDNILMDRIKKLKIKPFKISDKRQIVKKFILPEMCDSINVVPDNIIINDDDIDFIIDNYAYEAGVRKLKEAFEDIFSKLNYDKITNVSLIKSSEQDKLVLTSKVIIDYLGEPRIDSENIHNNNTVGVINGMYATDLGRGGILPIEVFINKIGSEVTYNLTGSQKRVMQESVKTAITLATNIVHPSKLLEHQTQNPFGLHIHTPGCAVSKDGPSAGTAFTVAIVSRILGKKVRNDVAITGEINLRGDVTKIGGLIYKLVGAKRAGIKLALVSEENKKDVDNILQDDVTLCDDNFQIKLVKNIIDALSYTLMDFDASDFVQL